MPRISPECLLASGLHHAGCDPVGVSTTGEVGEFAVQSANFAHDSGGGYMRPSRVLSGSSGVKVVSKAEAQARKITPAYKELFARVKQLEAENARLRQPKRSAKQATNNKARKKFKAWNCLVQGGLPSLGKRR